ncbi:MULTISPECIES: metallophosphoesterase [Bradyrhizobium]|uniref:metallophosphoesterase n=1 Tax=Bradyrhizobium TaxID=374 RepID=UPI0019578AA9|nr:metallophosphoesterase [Bradyrhizobium canariense]MBM7486066.1 putative phosphodiesterase [Bradyrhizobium canariense]UFW72910.1 metallophosphoesterase [Bradyrhizobium canariense]
MRLQIMSDLHLDPSRGVPPLADGVDVVAVAGDTCEGLVKAIDALRRAFPDPVQVVMVAGNHEYYGTALGAELAAGRARAREIGVHLLENGVARFGSLRVLGATLWTDYMLFGPTLRTAAMRAAGDQMRDHKKIKWSSDPWRRFRPEEALSLHNDSRRFFEAELANQHSGPTMLLAHHGMTFEAVAPPHERSLISAAYTSELSFLDQFGPDYVVTGHTHRRMDFRRGRTRFISNPRGYADEGVAFDPTFVLEVPDA